MVILTKDKVLRQIKFVYNEFSELFTIYTLLSFNKAIYPTTYVNVKDTILKKYSSTRNQSIVMLLIEYRTCISLCDCTMMLLLPICFVQLGECHAIALV